MSKNKKKRIEPKKSSCRATFACISPTTFLSPSMLCTCTYITLRRVHKNECLCLNMFVNHIMNDKLWWSIFINLSFGFIDGRYCTWQNIGNENVSWQNKELVLVLLGRDLANSCRLLSMMSCKNNSLYNIYVGWFRN